MKLLNNELRGTEKTEDARFFRENRLTLAYSPEMQIQVSGLLNDFVPLDPLKRIWNNGWQKTGEGLHFQREQIGWVAHLQDIKIQVMPDCDARDIHEWLSMFHSTMESPVGQNIKLKEQTMVISLGVFESEPSCVASEWRGEIAFHRLQNSSRLFATGIEQATSTWEKPTSLQHIFLHELAHFFLELHPELIDALMVDLHKGADYTELITKTSPDYLLPLWKNVSADLNDLPAIKGFAHEFIAELLADTGFAVPDEKLSLPVKNLFSPFPLKVKRTGSIYY